MRNVLRALLSRWVMTGVGALLLALMVWFLLPLLPPLRPALVRGGMILAIVLVWAGANVWLDWSRRKRDATLAAGAMEDGALEDGAAGGDAARAEEVAALREKLTRALALLRKASGRRGYLYEQPWYVMIGPPGAGKTTALLNAGLRFPLAEELGQAPVAGVGGTRLCDWWFTDEAILIDTAGRYTTQDSAPETDRAGWLGFLDLLRRTRPRQPLNGVLVAISAPDLAEAGETERAAHAGAIRRRLKELDERLGVRLPVYVLFTKTDLLRGFSEYFDDLERERREQVLGETFAPDLAAESAEALAGRVSGVIRTLAARLDARVADRLQAERSPERRALLAGFPAQFASLEGPLAGFVAAAFGGSRLDPAPWLRGIYFASGTQMGTPIDRLTGALARGFGIDQRLAPSLQPVAGRAYFLGTLLRSVVLGEAMLAGGAGNARRRAALRLAGFGGIALASVAAIAALLTVRAGQVRAGARLSAALAAYEQTEAALPPGPVANSDPAALLPRVDAARALPFGAEDAAEGGFALGLSEAPSYRAGVKLLYAHALQNRLLPCLLLRLEGQMRAHIDDQDFLYEALRVYLMLGGQGPMDAARIHAFEQADWSAAYPDPAVASSLLRHLDALLAAPLPPVALDGGLVRDAQSALANISLARRVYQEIRASADVAALPAWTPAAAIGDTGLTVFARASGKPLTDGIDGFFTVAGFHALLADLPDAARKVAAESWILGKAAQIDDGGGGLRALQGDVVHLYALDYEKAWDGLLADLTVRPLGGPDAAARTLYILASPHSPFRTLMTAIAVQLAPGKAAGAEKAAEGLEAKAGAAAARKFGRLFGGGAAGAAPPGSEIDAHFQPFVAYVGAGPGAPLDLAMQQLHDLAQQMQAMAGAGAGGAPAPSGGSAAGMLAQSAATAPPAIAAMLQTLAGGSSKLADSDAHKRLIDAYNAPDGPGALCARAVDGKFPFYPGAAAEIPLDDFARLFAPQGQFMSFFSTNLRPFVETGPTWRLQAVEGVSPPIGAGDLAQFQRAAAISQMFFAAGGAAPSLHFALTPLTLDAGAKSATLALGATLLTYAHGPVAPEAVEWPGPTGMLTARLSFDPAGALAAEGPWALFRLIGHGTLSPGASADQFTLSFAAGGHSMSYQLRAGSVLNPFASRVLQDFRCPHLQ